MLQQSEGKVTDRALRLFGVACVRRVWHLLRYERGRDAVEVAERFARGNASDREPADAFASMTKIPVGEGLINVPSPGWFVPEPSEALTGYQGDPGDHSAMAAAQAVCAPDARHCASNASRYSTDAVAELAWHEAETELDWSKLP